jgi:hypothetical protein
MASPTLTAQAKRPMTKLRMALIGIGVLAFAAVAWLLFNLSDLRSQAKLATAYGAHIACSCKFIAGRELDNCTRDFEPGMEMVSLSQDEPRKRVTASIPILASATAERRGSYGCIVLDDAELSAAN